MTQRAAGDVRSVGPLRSHLLEGKVRHRRARPFTYQLEHDVYSVALDVDELDVVARRLRLVGRNRRSIAEFRDADHLVEPARDVAAGIREQLRAEGVDPTGWRITLVTDLRVLGYVFSPASFFLCRDPEGTLRIVIVEVHNTFGERHLYTLRGKEQADPRGPFAAGMDKTFFVSPFIGMDGRYSVHVRDEPGQLRIAIAEREADGLLLSTSLLLRRLPLTDRNLLRMLIRHPLLPQLTIARIHWHALRLWRRGARFHSHGDWARSRRVGSAGEPRPSGLAGEVRA